MIRDKFNKYREKNGVTPLDLFNPGAEHVSDEELNARLSICLSCPNLIKITKQCNMCGCHMPSKAKFELAKCPLDKW
jgi:hypothetical protein